MGGGASFGGVGAGESPFFGWSAGLDEGGLGGVQGSPRRPTGGTDGAMVGDGGRDHDRGCGRGEIGRFLAASENGRRAGWAPVAPVAIFPAHSKIGHVVHVGHFADKGDTTFLYGKSLGRQKRSIRIENATFPTAK